MILGYNTNGLSDHDPIEAIQLIADIGYRGIGITIDQQWLNPKADASIAQKTELRDILSQNQMATVVETGARFLLDPTLKHEPTMVSPSRDDRKRRVDFYGYCIEQAAFLDSVCVSLWAGVARDGCSEQEAMDRLCECLEEVLEIAETNDVIVGFEPEPGMVIDTMAKFDRLLQFVSSPNLKLTLDVGHLFCQGEVPMVDYIERWKDWIVNVHIEDMKAGVHEHLMFGDGQIHFPPVMEVFKKIGYRGPINVELSRHSHNAAVVAMESYEFLSKLI